MDVVTEAPPPSRFFEEDLDNFSPRSPLLPSPFILLRHPQNPNPNLLIIAISPPSLSLLRSVPDKTLIGTLFLPELPLSSQNSSPIEIFSSGAALLVAVGCHVAPERSRIVAKLLLKELDHDLDRVLVLDSIRGESYRGKRLSADEDEGSVFKLETTEARKKDGELAKGVEYLGPGSLVDGFGAAVMVECEMRRRKGTMVVTWPPEGGREVVGVLKGLLRVLRVEVAAATAGVSKTRRADLSDLYT